MIKANNGFYNTDLNLLKIYNTEFNRNVYSSEGIAAFKINIKSDFAKWFKEENTIVFSSNNKQVETTIKLLTSE